MILRRGTKQANKGKRKSSKEERGKEGGGKRRMGKRADKSGRAKRIGEERGLERKSQ